MPEVFPAALKNGTMCTCDFLYRGCEMPDDDRYNYAENELLLESQRLHYGQAVHDPPTVECLEAIGVARGWRCLDVGAGAGSITRWLAQRVGPEGHVVALDYNTRFLTGLPNNVTVRQADVRE